MTQETTLERSLVVREAAGVERVIPLPATLDAPLTIGRGEDCAVRLQSPYASRQHARIELRDGEPVLVDLGSRNGTLLNGTRVEGTASLNHGDLIAIGDATIRCQFGGPASELTRTLVFQGATPVESTEPASPDALRVNADTYEVFVGEEPLGRRLSAQEFQLLNYLFQHRERVCTRQELGDSIWGRDHWDPNMLHRLVHRLKEKLEPNPERPRYVQTIPWVGYRLTP